MTTYTTLISAAELQQLQRDGAPLVVLDCGFDLSDPAAGERAHAAGHLPDAVYASLDNDLSGARSGRNGRHPLPQRAGFARRAGEWGIAPGVQVVCYDAHGSPYAARAWWLLRWLGHRTVAVLDGGVGAWRDAGGAMSTARPDTRPREPYPADSEPAMPTLDADAVAAALGRRPVVDARAADRFRGDLEPLDPVAGHIPGAVNRFFKDNLRPDGRFKPVADLQADFAALGAPATSVIHQCGSGVTACHNLLAMEHAGLRGSALYPGSWSEWCADPSRPVAQG